MFINTFNWNNWILNQCRRRARILFSNSSMSGSVLSFLKRDSFSVHSGEFIGDAIVGDAIGVISWEGGGVGARSWDSGFIYVGSLFGDMYSNFGGL